MKKIKLYTLYTETHKSLFDDYMFKSFKEKGLDSNFDLDITVGEQFSQTGNYASSGFEKTGLDKLKLFKRASEENENEIFCFSDVDIIFIGNFYKDAIEMPENIDILAQDENEDNMCTGFFFARGSKKLTDFFDFCIKQCEAEGVHDQHWVNTHKDMINYALLPKSRYCTIGHRNGIPESTLMFHANFIVGVGEKIKMLNNVKQLLKQ